jgi:hypothetical protein
MGSMFVSSVDTVTVRICNFSGAVVTPGQITLTAMLASDSLSGAASLSFPALENGSCADQTFVLKGVTPGEPVIPKWPSTFEAGILGGMRAIGDNRVEVRLCNFSGTTLTPARQSFGALITK